MSDSTAEIGFARLGLGSALKQYHLQIPLYQREYAWESKEVTTLLKDFARVIAEGDSKSYFLGTVVTIPRGGDILEVVDGQQRLTTAAILLAAIRDYVESVVPILAEHITGEILTGVDTVVLARVPRIRLNLDDNDYFRARLTRADPAPEPTKPSHRLIDGAFSEAKNRVKLIVSGLDKKDHGEALKRWMDFIVSRALVILLRVPNSSDAYRMFETLNDRGKRTSQSDLVKSYLFSRSGARQSEVHQSWSYMRGALASISEDDDITITFLRHSLTIIRGFVREADVFETVQNYAQGEQPVVTFAGQLEKLANVYVALYTTDHEKWNPYSDQTRNSLDVLNLFDIAPMRPLILAVASAFSESQTEKAFKLLVSIGVRLMITGATRTGTTEEGLADVAHKVFAGAIASCDQLKDGLKGMTPGDIPFRLAFEAATVSNHKLARYYLRSLEMAAKEEAQPWLIPNEDRNSINLEHVLPEKTLGNWPTFGPDIAKIYYRRLGNLALLRVSENSTLKSDAFSVKKAVYANAPYVLTSQIATAADWTGDTIVERQKGLAALALKTWAVGVGQTKRTSCRGP